MLRLDKVSKFYSSDNNLAVGVKNISLEFNIGEFVAIVGESGSGKSTLLNILSGLDTYEDGEMYVNNEETSHYTIEDFEKYRNEHISFIFQKYNLIKGFSVYKNIELSLILSGYQGDIDKRIRELVDKVGLTNRIKNKASQLSGGERQRVVIARALANDTNIIVADEPTGNLDSNTSKEIISLLQEVSKDKLVLIVTHDYDEVKDHVTRKVVMHDGVVQSDSKLQEYTKSLPKDTHDRQEKVSFLYTLRLAISNIVSTKKKSSILISIYLLFTMFLSLSIIGFTYFPYYAVDWNYSTSDDIIYVTKDSNFLYSDRVILASYLDDNSTMIYDGVYSASSFRLRTEDYSYSNGSLEYAEISEIDPATMTNKAGLKIHGSIPTSINEVIIPVSGLNTKADELIGQPVAYYSQYYGGSFSEDFIVVGYYYTEFNTAHVIEKAYFHPDYQKSVLDSLDNSYTSETFYLFFDGFRASSINRFFTLDNDLEDGEILLSNRDTQSLCYTLTYSLELEEAEKTEYCKTFINSSSVFAGKSSDEIYDMDLNVTVSDDFDYTADYSSEQYRYTLNQATLYDLTRTSYQNIAIYSPDETTKEALITSLENDGYTVSYYSYEPVIDDIFYLEELIITLFFIAIASILITITTQYLINIVQRTKTEEYNLIRSNGATKTTMKKIVLVEMLVMLLISFIIFTIILALVPYYNYYFIGYLRYSSKVYLLFIFLLYVLLGYRTVNYFVNTLYKKSITQGLSRGEKL